jgi:hypothetical protein
MPIADLKLFYVTTSRLESYEDRSGKLWTMSNRFVQRVIENSPAPCIRCPRSTKDLGIAGAQPAS